MLKRSLLVLFTVTLGCGGSTAASGTGDDAVESPPDTTAPTAGNEAGSVGAVATPTAPAASAAANMQSHFVDVGQAREAVIRGDLEAYRGPLRRVAAASYSNELPPGWLDGVHAMQETARAAADVRTVADAALAVASLARVCGECHTETQGGPEVADTQQMPAPAAGSALEQQMARHDWGAEQMWLGLTGPSRFAWVRGTQAIRRDAMQPRTAGRAPTPRPEIEQLHAAAERAEAAALPAARATAFGEVLTRCVGCHAASAASARH